MSDSSAKASAAVTFPLVMSNRPSAEAMLQWGKAAKALLPADQRALVDGYVPRAFHACEPLTLPAALVQNERNTHAMVAAREQRRLEVEDINKMRVKQLASLESEIKLNLFAAI